MVSSYRPQSRGDGPLASLHPIRSNVISRANR